MDALRSSFPLRLCAAMALAWLLAGTLAGPGPARAEGAVSEYELKAVFLFNLPQYVRWPEKAFPGPTAPISIGVLGDDPFGGALDRIVQGESVGGRKLSVKRARQLGDLDGCQVLYISASERGRLGAILGACQSRPVLTVSDIPGFSTQGGIVGFVIKAGKVRLAINAATAQRSGLQISSKLMRLAD